MLATAGKIAQRARAVAPRAVRSFSAESSPAPIVSAGNILPVICHASSVIGGNSFKFADATLFGDQSGGKTSTAIALLGLPNYFEIHNEIATKRPVRIVAQNTDHEEVRVQFSPRGKVISDPNVIRARMMEMNSGEITSDPIMMYLYSSRVPNMVLTDTPGYFQTEEEGQDENLPELVEQMNNEYLMIEESIKLVVLDATKDRATSTALKHVRRAGQMQNAMGILTKCDLVPNRDVLVGTLTDNRFGFGLGKVGVVLRSGEAVKEGTTVEEQLEVEKKFFVDNDITTVPTGIPHLRDVISSTQLERAMEQLPNMMRQVDKSRAKLAENLAMLSSLSQGDNVKSVAAGMDKLVESLHPIAPTRITFERQMRERIHETVQAKVLSLIEKNFTGLPPTYSNVLPETSTTTPIDTTRCLNAFRKATRTIDGQKALYWDDDRKAFDQTTVYGSCAVVLERDEMEKAYQANLAQMIPTAFVRFLMTGKSREHRKSWMARVELLVDDLIDDDIASDCVAVSMEEIVNAVDACYGNVETEESRMVKAFFEYILHKIVERTSSEQLGHGISTMILREKRPLVPLTDMSAAVMKRANISYEDAVMLWDDEKFPLRYPIYGGVWTQAWLDVFIEMITDDIYRMVATSVNDPLIRETFEISLRYFEGNNFKNEADDILRKDTELEKFHKIFADAMQVAKTKRKEREHDAKEREEREEERKSKKSKRSKKNRTGPLQF